MPDWDQILSTHSALIWQTVCRIVPTGRAAAVFDDAMLAAHEAAQRDSVSDWALFLQHIATARAIASIKQDVPPGDPSSSGQLRSALARLNSDHVATVFCLRYLSGLTFPEIAMQTRATLDSIGPTANEACTMLGRDLAAGRSPGADPTLLADDLLEAAVAEIRSSVPAGPDEDLLARTRIALANVPEIDFEKPPVPSRTMPLAIASALIVIIAFAVLAYFTYRPKPPAMDFAQMLEAIGTEQSARYYMVRNVELPDQRTRKVQSEVSVLAPGRLRQVMDPPGTVVVWNQPEQKALTLDTLRHRATLRDWADMFEDSRPIDAVSLLKQLKPVDGTPAGQTVMRGRPAQEFRVNRPDARMSVWADVESKLPIIVELKLPDATPPGDALMNEFVWGPPLDAAQFALEPPQGYELAAIKVNLKPATEQDLVKALGVAAKLNDGKFPSHFDGAGMGQLISGLYKKLPAKDSPEYRAAAEELEANLLQLGRGWLYIAEPENGGDWHYAGMDTMYGSDRPVFWYRPSGSSVYRVVNAALDVRSSQPDKLPDLPSIELSSAPTTRPALTPQILPPQP